MENKEYKDGECFYTKLPPTAMDNMNSRINSVSNSVANITPYTETKTAYIGDTECHFTKAKDGIITANAYTDNGNAISIYVEIFEEEVIVKFDELEEVATITISIQ